MSASGGKRCLYEVLGVSRDASANEIRSAYRRLALQLHPDKAPSSSSSTSAFQDLVNAYEILSDPKERSYYDSHRSQILFSDLSSTSNSKKTSFPVDLFTFFSSSAFSGFSDSGRGFYKVYADVFDSIYRQELAFNSRMGLDEGSAPAPPPLLGNLDSPYAQVNAFYSYWIGFVTVMDFGWTDMYDSAAGENRRSRRAMEEENRKIRRKAKREYNENVRALAEFVKKRDRRVIEMVRRRKEEEEKRKEEGRERKRKEEERRKEAANSYEEPEWAKVVEEEVVEEEDENKDGEMFYCVACSKKFKSEKQWKNHEQSKKHKEKVLELRDAFSKEDGEVVGGGDDGEVVGGGGCGKVVGGGDGGEVVGGDGSDEVEEEVESGEGVGNGNVNCEGSCTRSSNDAMEDETDGVVDDLCEELDEGLRCDEGDGYAGLGIEKEELELDEESFLEAMISGHKSRKKDGNVDQSVVVDEKLVVGGDDSEVDGPMVYENKKKGRRNRRKGTSKRDTSEDTGAGDVPGHGEVDAKDMASESHQDDDKWRSNLGDHASGKNRRTKKQQVNERGAGKGKKNKVKVARSTMSRSMETQLSLTNPSTSILWLIGPNITLRES